VSEEKTALLAALAAQRRHVLGALDGLTDEQLARPVLPSGWSCRSLVHHLAVDVERFWFRAVMVDEADAWASLEGVDGWSAPADVDVPALYRQEAARADAVLAATALDSPPARWPTELFGDFRMHDLREVLLHVLTETSVHAGHLDAARELLDGKQWTVL
jgi:hypothetical protein